MLSKVSSVFFFFFLALEKLNFKASLLFKRSYISVGKTHVCPFDNCFPIKKYYSYCYLRMYLRLRAKGILKSWESESSKKNQSKTLIGEDQIRKTKIGW